LVVDDRQLTFGQYRQAVGGVAAHLASHVGRGDTVALVMGNSIEMAVADFGAQVASAQVAPLNPNLTDRELTPLFEDIAPSIVLCAPLRPQCARIYAPGRPMHHKEAACTAAAPHNGARAIHSKSAPL
jgi:acyl-CoA synthetase (AMP-forming)/AMP-acid ligase II